MAALPATDEPEVVSVFFESDAAPAFEDFFASDAAAVFESPAVLAASGGLV